MAESAAVATITDNWDDGKRIHVIGTLAIGASPGTYTTGGIALDWTTQTAIRNAILGITAQPVRSELNGKAGYKYEYDKTAKKLIIRQVSPAGTNDPLTFTGTPLATHSHQLHFQTSAAANAVTAASNQLRTAAAAFNVAGVPNTSGEGGVVDITAGTPAGTINTPGFTGTAAPMAELPASSMPAGVSGDVIDFYVIFKKFA